jgi:thiamine biosynthesis protein ThiS
MTMAIRVNGEQYTWRDGLTVEALLKEKHFSFPLITVFVNGQRIQRTEYGTWLLKDQDDVHVVHLMSGG